MLTIEDIQKLTEYQTTVFVTKQQFDEKLEELKTSFSVLQSAVDRVLTEGQTKEIEETTLAYRMKNAEDWIGKASPKLELEFKH